MAEKNASAAEKPAQKFPIERLASVFDATRMRAQIGTFGIKPQYITEIFVDKENAELASHIIRTL